MTKVFRLENVSGANGAGGLADLQSWATSNGYQWAPYNNDENGSLSGVVTDELVDPNVIDYFCTIFDDIDYWSRP